MYKKSFQFSRNDKNIDSGGIFLCNPRIIARSPEIDMKVWTEECLVLPPTFTATVLRDASILVQYENLDGVTISKYLTGELARALQHEMDHDRGILILDHVDLNKMESLKMKRIERDGHEDRMALAYSRYIDVPTRNLTPKLVNNPFIQPSNALENKNEVKSKAVDDTIKNSVQTECDDECKAQRKKVIEERRALMKQSKSNTSRRDVLELSRQRSALYDTPYRGL